MKLITYKCDVCREEHDSAKLYGFEFGNVTGQRFRPVLNRDCERHICLACWQGMVDLYQRTVADRDEARK